MPNQATSIYVHTRRHESAVGTAAALRKTFPDAFVRPWTEDSAYLRSAIGSIEAIGAVTTGMVIIAVAIPVLALLYISVLARRRDIALLMGIGFTRFEVFYVFLLQALCVGVVGLGLGELVAYGLVSWFQAHPLFAWQGFVVRPIASLQSSIQPACSVLGAAVVAGVYPAIRAASLDPATILRSSD
jgi:ABC-type lipoprotein release transport system permease subunit